MARSFLSSPAFLVAGLLALAILAAGAASYAYAPALGWDVTSEPGCDAPVLAGASLGERLVSDATEGGVRTVTYALDASALRGGVLDACASVGAIRVVRAEGTEARVTFTIGGPAAAVERTQVAAEFRAADGALVVGAWQVRVGGAGSFLMGVRGADLSIVVALPDVGAFDVKARADVGDVRVEGALVGNLTLQSDVGSLVVDAADVLGNVSMHSDVGDLQLRPASLQTGEIGLGSDTGAIDVTLPGRAEIGYDVRASSDVGSVTVSIGPTEEMTREDDGPGETVHARSSGYAGKPTRVALEARSDVGRIRVEVAS